MKSQGFSLLEWMVVCAVIAIVLNFGMVSLQTFKAKNESQTVIDEITMAVDFAKFKTLQLRQAVQLSPIDFSGDWSKGIRLTYYNHHSKQTKLIHQWQWHHPRLRVSWSGSRSDQQIDLLPNPAHAISNGQFTLTEDYTQKQIKIVMNRLGRIRIED